MPLSEGKLESEPYLVLKARILAASLYMGSLTEYDETSFIT